MTPAPLRISYLPNGSFVLPIIAAIKGHPKPAVRTLGEKWGGSDLSLLGASLSTKITMLGLLSERLYRQLTPLYVELGQQDDLESMLQGGYTWLPSQRQLPYEILLECDLFIYEFRSAYEILGKFLRRFSKDILGRPVAEDDLLDVLKARNIDTAWVRELQERRKLWFHEHAAWLAFLIHEPNPPEADLVFLANADSDPLDPTESLPLRGLHNIYRGFDKTLRELQAWAVREVAAL